MVNKKEITKENHNVLIGPLMKKAMDKQKESIIEVTMGVCDPSYWDAGEILAKKLFESNLI